MKKLSLSSKFLISIFGVTFLLFLGYVIWFTLFGKTTTTINDVKAFGLGNQGDRFLIPGAINNECVAFSIIEIE